MIWGLSSFWRGCGGLLSALVLAVLAMGPSLDALVCRDDVAAHATADQGLAASSDAPADPDPAQEPCVHGHCHHVAPAAAATTAALTERLLGSRSPHGLIDVALPPGRLPFGLERPPRT